MHRMAQREAYASLLVVCRCLGSADRCLPEWVVQPCLLSCVRVAIVS